jgi:hypothetical protein
MDGHFFVRFFNILWPCFHMDRWYSSWLFYMLLEIAWNT